MARHRVITPLEIGQLRYGAEYLGLVYTNNTKISKLEKMVTECILTDPTYRELYCPACGRDVVQFIPFCPFCTAKFKTPDELQETKNDLQALKKMLDVSPDTDGIAKSIEEGFDYEHPDIRAQTEANKVIREKLIERYTEVEHLKGNDSYESKQRRKTKAYYESKKKLNQIDLISKKMKAMDGMPYVREQLETKKRTWCIMFASQLGLKGKMLFAIKDADRIDEIIARQDYYLASVEEKNAQVGGGVLKE